LMSSSYLRKGRSWRGERDGRKEKTIFLDPSRPRGSGPREGGGSVARPGEEEGKGQKKQEKRELFVSKKPEGGGGMNSKKKKKGKRDPFVHERGGKKGRRTKQKSSLSCNSQDNIKDGKKLMLQTFVNARGGSKQNPEDWGRKTIPLIWRGE